MAFLARALVNPLSVARVTLHDVFTVRVGISILFSILLRRCKLDPAGALCPVVDNGKNQFRVGWDSA